MIAKTVTCMVGVAALAGAALLCPPGSSAASSGWTTPRALSAPVRDVQDLHVAAAANADAIAVWREVRWTGNRVMASVRLNGGVWRVPRDLSGRSGGSKVQAAMNAHGAVVAWTSAHRILVARYRDSAGWTRPHSVTRGDLPNLRDLAIAIDGRGVTSVVWSQSSRTKTLAYAGVKIVRRAPGHRWGTPVRLTGSPKPHMVADGALVSVDRRGDTTVAWHRWMVGSTTKPPMVIVRRRRAGARAWAAARPLGTAQSHSIRLTMNGRGDTAVVWLTGENAGQVWTAIRPPGGSWLTSRLTTPYVWKSRGAQLALDAAGDAAVVSVQWSEQVPWPHVVVNQRPAGGAWQAPVVLGSRGDYAPNVAMEPEGTAIVLWRGMMSDSLQSTTLVPGGEWAPVETVSTGYPAKEACEVATDSAGHVVAAWKDLYEGQVRVMVATG